MTLEQDSFQQRIYQLVAAIPYGNVTTYGEVARLVGSSRAARQVVTLVPVVTTCFTVLVINISLPSTLTAALSRMRAFGWIPARLNGRVNWNGACLPSVRPTRCTAL